MNRRFITFSEGQQFEELYDSLEYSILAFSKYKLVKYKASDFNIKWQPDNWKSGYVFIYKILSCIKALQDYDEVVWVDTDLVVTPNIDTIWQNKNDGFPLLPLHRFYNFEYWPHSKFNLCDPEAHSLEKAKIGLKSNDFPNFYYQACLMKIDKSCLGFLNEVLGFFEDYDEIFSPTGDEIIINVLLWKYKIEKNLGNVNLCSYCFSANHIKKFINCKSKQDYIDLFDPEIKPEDEFGQIILSNGLPYSEWNRKKVIDPDNTILIFHGNKIAQYHKSIVDLMIEKVGFYSVAKKTFSKFPF